MIVKHTVKSVFFYLCGAHFDYLNRSRKIVQINVFPFFFIFLLAHFHPFTLLSPSTQNTGATTRSGGQEGRKRTRVIYKWAIKLVKW